jgi:hypothetical protein
MKYQLRDRVIMVLRSSKYTGEIGTVVNLDSVEDHVVNLVVQFDCNQIGHHVRLPSHYFELYFRKESQELDLVTRLVTAPENNRPATLLKEAAVRIEYLEKRVSELKREKDAYKVTLQSYSDLNKEATKQNTKLRSTLVHIQNQVQDILRPIPFQGDEE